MTQLLWPARSRSYFQLDTPELDVSDELEEFSQATHVLLSEAGRAASPDRPLDQAPDSTADRTADGTGDEARDQTADQTRWQGGEQPLVAVTGPPPLPLPDVTRGAAAGPARQPADSSVFSPVDADTQRLLPEPVVRAG